MFRTAINRIFCAVSTAAILLLGACAPQQIEPPKTQLQIRQFQTRSYHNRNTRAVMKAVINALQDEAFIIKNADKELGFITASKDVDVEDRGEAFWAILLQGAEAHYKKNSIVECSANISKFGSETKVRLVFQTKVLDNQGNPLQAKQVQDEHYYQDFFAKVDKSIFIEREKL